MNRLQTIKQMLADSPNDIFLHYAVAIELMSNEDYEAAINKLKEIQSISPDYLPIYYQMGQLFEKMDLEDAAIEAYNLGYQIAINQNNHKTAAELKSALEELKF